MSSKVPVVNPSKLPIALLMAGSTALAGPAWALSPGQEAPACSAPPVDGGRAISVADYRGKVVYLDFWASWCAPCRESFPFMSDLQRDLGGKGLQIVAVSVDKTADEAKRFLARYPASFTVVLDAAAACPAAYALEGMPSSFIIDRSGIVRMVHSGFRDSDREQIRRQLAEALGK
jgi:cytochrome c biogenesis protein CcmG, thiol:disulfide interchange protein DsbE